MKSAWRPWRTLRGRLTGAMLAVLLLSVAISSALDELDDLSSIPILRVLDREPYQDGLVLALFSLPALLLVWLVSSWSLRPLTRASKEAGMAGPRDPARRLSRTGLPAEITPLVDAVNGALDRMSDAFEAERRFTENAAHELRTPLAVLGLRLQRARQAEAGSGTAKIDWTAVEHDLGQMNRLVAQLLDLARKENAGRDPAGSPLTILNLSRIAREAAASVLPLAEADDRPLVVDLPDVLTIQGHCDDLRDSVRNLLENALMHGRGTVSLHGSMLAATQQARLVIHDEGQGIPAEQRHAAFERFQKGRTSQGSGLGLAIVRAVMRNHAGTVALRSDAPRSDGGFAVELTLPAHSPRAENGPVPGGASSGRLSAVSLEPGRA